MGLGAAAPLENFCAADFFPGIKISGWPWAAVCGPGLAARLLVYSEDTNADDTAGIFVDSALLCFENFRCKLSATLRGLSGIVFAAGQFFR